MKAFLNFLFLIFFILCQDTYAFTFQLNISNETCSGNGSVQISLDQTMSNATYTFEIYKQPNLSTPILITNNVLITGLNDGTYKIIVKENNASVITSLEANFTILDQTVPLDYEIQNTQIACSDQSSLTIITNSGNPINYEIISGPVTRPLQNSNTFSNLPVGTYQIRVVDNCGTAVVKTFTLVTSSTGLNMTLTNVSLIDCDTSNYFFSITPYANTQIAYPLFIQMEYVINNLNSIQTITIPNGNELQTSFNQILSSQINTFNFNVLDNCGSNYSFEIITNNEFNVTTTLTNLPCNNYYFTTTFHHGIPPYQIQFINAPSSFIPSQFNSSFTGSTSDNSIAFGSTLNPVPSGTYNLEIIDNCGNQYNEEFVIPLIQPIVNSSGFNTDCTTNTGTIRADIPNFGISSAQIISAPALFNQALPYSVSNFIIDGILQIENLPAGIYTLILVNACTNELSTIEVTIPNHTNKGVTQQIRNGCNLGTSAILIKSKNAAIIDVTLLNGPLSYATNYPIHLNNNIIANGQCLLDNLLPGNYSFQIIDTCNYSNTVEVSIIGYQITNESFTVLKNCGSFDISTNFENNATTANKYWLQKLIDPVNQTWGHPISEVLFTSTTPNASNSILLINNATNYNFSFNGTFRIVHSFQSYNNGESINLGLQNSINKNCFEIIEPSFSYNESLEIMDAFTLPCSDVSHTVVINATGTPPLNYSIVSFNNNPFLISNNTNSTFTGLAPGTYTFQVEDSCGNRVQQVYDLLSMPSLLFTNTPNSLHQCVEHPTDSVPFDLTPQVAEILGGQNSNNYSVIFYESLSDLNSNTNPIQNTLNYTPQSTPFRIYAKAYYNHFPNCFQIQSFELINQLIPSLNIDSQYLICDDKFILDLNSQNNTNTTYTWSTGINGPKLELELPGSYSISVVATTIDPISNFSCSNSKSFEVIISKKPKIKEIQFVDWTWNDLNTIYIIMENNGAYLYAINEQNYTNNATFESLNSGSYTVWAKDIYGCGIDSKTIELLNYPHYFTPNNDGINDTWKLMNMNGEPDLSVEIFDRFGKLIYSMFGSNPTGWNGEYNNFKMPSDDYWFLVTRQNKIIHKGHFSLKR